MAKTKGGFDPDRLGESNRPGPVVPQIVEAPMQMALEATGFTLARVIGTRSELSILEALPV